MKSKVIARHEILLLSAALGILVLAACDRAPAPASSAPAADVSTNAAPKAAEPANTVKVVLGKYVDPTTMAVGGISTEFLLSDRLFAGVDFAPVAAGTAVSAAIRDSAGQEIVRREASVSNISQTANNFDLGTPTDLALKPGRYVLEATAGNQPVATMEFAVR